MIGLVALKTRWMVRGEEYKGSIETIEIPRGHLTCRIKLLDRSGTRFCSLVSHAFVASKSVRLVHEFQDIFVL